MSGLMGGATLKSVGENWLRYEYNIAIDPERAVGFGFRFRQNYDPSGGTKKCYAGLVGVAADGVTGVDASGSSVDLSDESACKSAAWCYAVQGVEVVADGSWHNYVAYWSPTGSGAQGGTSTAPGKLPAAMKYGRIQLAFNVGASGTYVGETECDVVTVYDATAEIGATISTGDTGEGSFTLSRSGVTVFRQPGAPTNPTPDGYALKVDDLWFSTDTTTGCPDAACKGCLDGDGTRRAGNTHREEFWGHHWTGSAWLDGTGNRLLIKDEIAANAIQTTDYDWDSDTGGIAKADAVGTVHEYATQGAKIQNTRGATGMALLVGPSGLRVGKAFLNEWWIYNSWQAVGTYHIASGSIGGTFVAMNLGRGGTDINNASDALYIKILNPPASVTYIPFASLSECQDEGWNVKPSIYIDGSSVPWVKLEFFAGNSSAQNPTASPVNLTVNVHVDAIFSSGTFKSPR